MHVTILGAGYVGVTTAVNLAELGHDVTVVELDETRREALNQGTDDTVLSGSTTPTPGSTPPARTTGPSGRTPN